MIGRHGSSARGADRVAHGLAHDPIARSTEINVRPRGFGGAFWDAGASGRRPLPADGAVLILELTRRARVLRRCGDGGMLLTGIGV